MLQMTKTLDSETSFYLLKSTSRPQFTLHILVRNNVFIHYHHFVDEKTEPENGKQDHITTQWHSQGPYCGNLFQIPVSPLMPPLYVE